MTNSKMTYVDALNIVLNTIDNGEQYANPNYFEGAETIIPAVSGADLVEKLTALRDSVAKRNAHKSDKPTKAQIANAELGESIVATMESGVNYTCSDIGKLFGLNPQKVSPLMKGLLDAGRVTSEKVKGKVVYRLA